MGPRRVCDHHRPGLAVYYKWNEPIQPFHHGVVARFFFGFFLGPDFALSVSERHLRYMGE